LQVNENLKFALKYKFIKRETRGLEFCFAGSQLQGKHEVRPLIPLFKSLVCLQLRDEVEVKTPRTLEVRTIVPHVFYAKGVYSKF